MSSILAKSIGRAIARRNGLRRIELPEELGPDFLSDVVGEACQERPGAVPFSLLVGTPGQGLDSAIVPNWAAKFRSGNHVIVHFTGDFSSKTTLDGVFHPLLRDGYPDFIHGKNFESADLSLKAIATEIASLLLEHLDDSSDDDLDMLVEVIDYVYTFTASAIRLDGRWVSRWWLHFRDSLDELFVVVKKNLNLLASVIPELVFACAGLPQPDDKASWRYDKRNSVEVYTNIIEDSWQDAQSIQTQLRTFEVQGGVKQHSLRTLSWDLFKETRLAHTNAVTAVLHHGLGSSQLAELVHATAWRETSESEFFLKSPSSSNVDLVIRLNGKGLPQIADTNWQIVPADVASFGQTSAGKLRIQLNSVSIAVPQRPDRNRPNQDIEATSVAVKCKNGLSFDVKSVEIKDAEFLLHGSLFLEQHAMGVWPEKPFKISIHSGIQDLVQDFVFNATAFVLFPSPAMPLFVVRERRGKSWRTPVALGGYKYEFNNDQFRIAETEEFEPVIEVVGSGLIDIYAYDSASEETQGALACGEKEGEQDSSWGRFSKLLKCNPQDDLHFEIGEHKASISIAQVVATPPFLPLAAAASGMSPSDDAASSTMEEDLRGKLEELFFRPIIDKKLDGLSSTLGQIALPVGHRATLGSGQIENQEGVYWPKRLNPKERQLRDASMLKDYFDADQLSNFWKAFDELDYGALSTRKLSNAEGSEQSFWPSRTSLLNLPTDRVENYLQSFINLVESAAAIDSPAARFWACYPFSVFIFDPETHGSLKAVLLSPLHPVRLAWLWSCEQAVASWNQGGNSDHRLMQLITGWNFPLLSPSLAQVGGRKVAAIPVDTGEEDLFLGWSFLVDFDNQTGQAPKMPDLAAGMAIPGASSSGLSEGGVGAALRDFLRVCPHTSTLTIDLSADSKAPRMKKLDEAIVMELAEIVVRGHGSGLGLPGGVRVLDSMNRSGLPPTRDEVLSRAKLTEIPFPFAWTRYAPPESPEDQEKVDIRFVQDTASSIAVTQTPGSVRGSTIPPVPLKRFFSRRRNAQNQLLISYGLRDNPDCILPSFSRSIQVMESSDNELPSELSVQLLTNVAQDTNASWTILGDMYLDPVTLNKLISHGDNDARRLIWEWRPPYLSRRSQKEIALFERRPYISIASIPKVFVELLSKKVAPLVDGINIAPNKAVKRVLATLGERGVGLASLLAMGHHHESGAIGFYFALQLCQTWIESVESEHVSRFVLPVDAVDDLLKSIVGEEGVSNETRRADLLAMEINCSGEQIQITFIPIEIKCYGFNTETSAGFPNENGASVKGGMEQLSATQTRISDLVQLKAEVGISRDALQLNGFATLLETAFLLSRGNKEDVRQKALFATLRGCIEWRLGSGLLLWFQVDGGNGMKMLPPMYRPTNASNTVSHAKLFIDPLKCGNELWGEEKVEVSDSFVKTMNWCVGHDGVADDNQTANPDSGADVVQNTDTSTSFGHSEEQSDDSPQIHDDNSIGEANDQGNPELLQINLGCFTDSISGEQAYFEPNDTRLTQMNIGVAGDLGTGKTQLLKSLIHQFSTNNLANRGNAPKTLILDYKEDYSKKDPLFHSHFESTILEPIGIPLNFFSTEGCASANPRYERARSFFDILHKIYPGIGPVQQENFVACVMSCYNNSVVEPTVYDVLVAYKELVPKPDSISSALTLLTQSGVLENDHSKLKTFSELFRQSIVVNLGALGTDVTLKNVLVTIFLNFYYEYMLRIKKQGFLETDDGKSLRVIDSFLLVDEAHNILSYDFQVLHQLLLQGREFGIGIILASQFLSHFDKGKTDWKEALNTWFIFKVPKVTSKNLKDVGIVNADNKMATLVPTLKLFNCVYKDLNGKGRPIRVRPFFETIRND